MNTYVMLLSRISGSGSMFRYNNLYIKYLARFHASIKQLGYDGDINVLIGTLDVSKLEEVMLSSFRLMKYIRRYLDLIKCQCTEGVKVRDLYSSIKKVMDFTGGLDKSRYLDEEAILLETVSRSCYAWLKSFRMLEPARAKAEDEIKVDFDLAIKRGLERLHAKNFQSEERAKIMNELNVARQPAIIKELIKRLRELEE